MRKFVAILLGAILVVTQVAAQNKTIKGRVTEDGKKPLSNASIIVKGTTVASKTNEEGYYSITIPANGRVLKFSSLNFEDQEVNIGSKSEINVILVNTVSDLQQVLVKEKQICNAAECFYLRGLNEGLFILYGHLWSINKSKTLLYRFHNILHKCLLFISLYTTNFTEPLSYQDSAFLKLPKFP